MFTQKLFKWVKQFLFSQNSAQGTESAPERLERTILGSGTIGGEVTTAKKPQLEVIWLKWR